MLSSPSTFTPRGAFRMRFGTTAGEGAPRLVLSEDDIRRAAPSVFAETPWAGMTDKYLFVPTIEIVRAMRAEGYQVVGALQGNVRIEGKGDYTKHLIRFAMPSAPEVHGSTSEIALVNSHDGSSSYRLMHGVYRSACTNKLLWAADVVGDLRFRHSKRLKDDIIEGTGTLVREAPKVAEEIERLASVRLSDEEQGAFAAAAHTLRWDGHAPVTPVQLLHRRRQTDVAPDAWTTLNVVQENLMRGGLAGRTSTNRRTTTRAVAGVTENVRLNEALTVLARELTKARLN